MMNCNEINESISLYIDQMLDEDQLAEFEAHLAGCEECRREVEEISRLVKVCTGFEEEELPEGFTLELHQKLLDAGAAEQPDKKLLIFPMHQLKVAASIAAGLAVVVIAAFLVKGMLLTPSGTSKNTGNLAIADRRMAKAENAQAADAAGGSTGSAADSTANADEYSISGTQSETDNKIIVQFSEAIPGESQSSADFGGDDTKAAAPSKAKTDGEGSRGNETKETTAVNAAPNVASALKITPEKRVTLMTVFTQDTEKTSNGLVKLLLDNGGEKVEPPAGVMSVETTAGVDSKQLAFRIPNASYAAFRDAALKAYGQENVSATEPVNEDLSGRINDLQKQSDDLGAQIQKAENKKTELTAEELLKLKDEKKAVDTQLESVRSQLDYTYITLTITKK